MRSAAAPAVRTARVASRRRVPSGSPARSQERTRPAATGTAASNPAGIGEAIARNIPPGEVRVGVDSRPQEASET